MLRSRLDLLGIYNFDNTVLDLLEVPEDEDGNDLIDRDTLKDNLLMDTAEMEILYPDASFLKLAIGAWSKSKYLSGVSYMHLLSMSIILSGM